MYKQKIHFVVDESLDIENHLIGLWTYANKTHLLMPGQAQRYKKLSKLSPAARKRFLKKELRGGIRRPRKKC